MATSSYILFQLELNLTRHYRYFSPWIEYERAQQLVCVQGLGECLRGECVFAATDGKEECVHSVYVRAEAAYALSLWQVKC